MSARIGLWPGLLAAGPTMAALWAMPWRNRNAGHGDTGRPLGLGLQGWVFAPLTDGDGIQGTPASMGVLFPVQALWTVAEERAA